MKTIVIWDQCGQEPIKFFILKGDKTHLDGIYINNAEQDPELQEELTDMVFDESGNTIMKMYKKFPMQTVRRPDTKVITCGFLP